MASEELKRALTRSFSRDTAAMRAAAAVAEQPEPMSETEHSEHSPEAMGFPQPPAAAAALPVPAPPPVERAAAPTAAPAAAPAAGGGGGGSRPPLVALDVSGLQNWIEAAMEGILARVRDDAVALAALKSAHASLGGEFGAFKSGTDIALAAHAAQLSESASRAWVEERLKDALRRAGGLDAQALEDAVAGARAAAMAAERAKASNLMVEKRIEELGHRLADLEAEAATRSNAASAAEVASQGEALAGLMSRFEVSEAYTARELSTLHRKVEVLESDNAKLRAQVDNMESEGASMQAALTRRVVGLEDAVHGDLIPRVRASDVAACVIAADISARATTMANDFQFLVSRRGGPEPTNRRGKVPPGGPGGSKAGGIGPWGGDDAADNKGNMSARGPGPARPAGPSSGYGHGGKLSEKDAEALEVALSLSQQADTALGKAESARVQAELALASEKGPDALWGCLGGLQGAVTHLTSAISGLLQASALPADGAGIRLELSNLSGKVGELQRDTRHEAQVVSELRRRMMAAEVQCDNLDRIKADKEVTASRHEMERLNKEALAALARAQNLLITRLGVTEEKIDNLGDALKAKAARADVISRDTLDAALGEFVKRSAVEDRLSFLDEAKAPVSALGPLEGRLAQRIDRLELAAAGSLKETLKALEVKLLAHLAEKAGKEETSGLRAALRKHLTVAHAPGRAGPTLPTAAIRKMDYCLTCNQPVAHAFDELMAERRAEASGASPQKTGGLPAADSFHNTFGGLVASDPVGSAFNANLAKKRRDRDRLLGSASRSGGGLHAAGHRPNTAPEPAGPDGGAGTGPIRAEHWGWTGGGLAHIESENSRGGVPRPQTSSGGGVRKPPR